MTPDRETLTAAVAAAIFDTYGQQDQDRSRRIGEAAADALLSLLSSAPPSGGEADKAAGRVAEFVADNPAWADYRGIDHADLRLLLDERARLLALTATCSCATTYATYEGPEADCPVHGAVRGFNEATAACERLTAERDSLAAALSSVSSHSTAALLVALRGAETHVGALILERNAARDLAFRAAFAPEPGEGEQEGEHLYGYVPFPAQLAVQDAFQARPSLDSLLTATPATVEPDVAP